MKIFIAGGGKVGATLARQLAGRLEIFPILVLLSRSTWRRR